MPPVVDIIRRGLPVVIIATVLMTTGAALVIAAFNTATQRRLTLIWAGLFAALYGFRLGMNTPLIAAALGGPPWISYLRSSLEYLVPIPAALLFQSYRRRWRWPSLIASALFIGCAAIAIPFEIATHDPGRLTGVVNAFIVPLMVVIFANAVSAARAEPSRELRVLIAASVIFAAFVVWQHAVGGNLAIDAPTEMLGFLVFVGAIVYVVIRVATTEQMQLFAVRGELEAARTIQSTIIPRTPPKIAQLDIAALYAPAAEVGGDFYDFVAIDDVRAGFFIADVSGHGVPAALVASMLKIALATQASLATDPAALLAALNTLFIGKLGRQFVTAAYVFVDVAASRAIVAGAGHPPPLVVRNGEVSEAIATGPILGKFAKAQFEAVTMPFDDDDAIVLYTDGVTEARDANDEQFGDARLRALVRETRAQEVVNAIAAAVSRWSAVRDDDVTLLVVHRERATISTR